MRTAIIIACGLILWALCLAIARWQGGGGAGFGLATWVFLILWLAAAAFNLWWGVTRAGYAFGEELPIFLLIFALPAAAAVFVKFKWLSAPLN